MLRENRNSAQLNDHLGVSGGAGSSAEGFDLKGKIKVLLRRRRLIIVTTLIVTCVTALVSLSLESRYVTVASVLLDQRRTNVIDTDSVVQEERTDSRALAAEINLLRSRTYAEKVVEELELLSDPQFNPTIEAETGPLTVLGERLSGLSSFVPPSWIDAASTYVPRMSVDQASNIVPESWRVAISDHLPDSWLVAVGLAEQVHPSYPSSPRAEEDPLGAMQEAVLRLEASEPLASLPTPDSEAYELLMQSAVSILLAGLQIRPGAGDLLLIEATSGDPGQAAQIADTVAELYVQDQLAIKRQAVEEAVGWLKERVGDLRERVLSSEGAVVAYQEEHGLASSAAPRQEGGARQELNTARAERAQKEELLAWVRGLRERGASLDTIAAVLSLPTLPSVREQQTELQRQEAMLRMKYGDRHREIIQLDASRHPINIERQYLAERLQGEIGAAIRKLEGEIAFARSQESDLEERLGQAEPEASPSARAEVQLRDLQRQADADRSLYVAFLNRFKEVSEQQNLLESGATVGSRAGIPGEPDFPKPGLMIFAGFTVSMTLGTLLAFLVEYLDNGLRTGRQMERLLGVPNLGFVPNVNRLKSRQKLHRYLIENPRSAYTEAIRRVQIATMDAGDLDQASLVVLVTSSLPGEGKTTLALSLGASTACSGRRTVVVDLDLRRPRVHSETGLEPTAGVGEFLAGDMALDDIVYPSGDHPDLDIVPVKSLPKSPADLVRSPRMATLLAELKERYQYIVLDTPPLLGVVDAKLVARLADAVLFVARWEKTKETAAQTGFENLLDRHTPPIGAVLTRVDVRRHAKRGYGESVQYYSKYEAYYK